MELETALKKLGELTQKNAEQEAELVTLRKHKADLEADLGNAREAKKAAESERDELKSKVPTENSLVLGPSDAKRWKAYNDLGEPETLSKAIADAKETEKRLWQKERDDAIREAGYDPVLLSPHLGDASFKTVAEGDKKKVVVSFKDGDKDVETPFGEWATSRGLDSRLDRMRLEGESAPTGRGDLTPPASDYVGDYLKRKEAKHGN